MELSKFSIFLLLVVLMVTGSIFGYVSADESESKEFVVTLDHSNFTDFVAKHKFIVIEFYAPWRSEAVSLDREDGPVQNRTFVPNIACIDTYEMGVKKNDCIHLSTPDQTQFLGKLLWVKMQF